MLMMMSYLVPFSTALLPDQPAQLRAILLLDEPGIPDDTYQLLEFYCPNPGCDCREVLLKVFAVQQKTVVANIRVPLPLFRPPALDPAYLPDPLAQAVLRLVSRNLQNDPAYLQQLQEHYRRVKTVAADPTHSAYPALQRWAQTGTPKPPRRKKH
jgi:hypothetical protein